MRASRRAQPIVVHRPTIKGERLQVRIDPGSAAKYLHSGTFSTRYSGLDPHQVPAGVRALPALGTVLTVAMAAGVPVQVDEVDAEFAAGIDEMAVLWRRLYPRFRTSGFELRGDRVATETEPRQGELLLWSGGLDCTASLIERRSNVRALFTVWGADVELKDAELWRALNATFDDNPLLTGLNRVTARSNLRRFPIAHTLVHDFLAPGESWWGRVQHGLALAGLAAPVTMLLGTAGLIRAASFSPGSNQPTGSMPELDALTRWSGVQVRHEGFELTRQQKISERLRPYLDGGGGVRLGLCYQRGRHDGTGRVNCGRCEKCLRTAGGLLVAGIDPTVVGLPIQPDAYDLWTRKLTDGLGLSRHTLPFWQENRAALTAQTPRPTDPAAARFLAALATSPVRLADTGVNRYEYLRNYWTRRRNVRLRELRAAVDATTQRTRRRVAALVRGTSPQTL